MKTFSQFLDEKDKLFQVQAVTYGTGQRGQTPGMAMAHAGIAPAKPASPKNPFAKHTGMVVAGPIYGPAKKRPPSWVLGKK